MLLMTFVTAGLAAQEHDERYVPETDPECPFSINPRANVTKEIFTAFREQGFWTGAYFSKPDWHSEYYWWPNFATPTRSSCLPGQRCSCWWISWSREATCCLT